MHRMLMFGLAAVLPAAVFAGEAAIIGTEDLRPVAGLEEPRIALIDAALEVAKEVKGLPYVYGGNGVEDGGFDCSGAIFHVLRGIGLEPPRTSADQFLWVQEHSEIHPVASTATGTDDKSLSDLKPGDLLFWSGTYEPGDGRKVNITHVALFMGYEKSDGRPVMINATDGRSYRGEKGSGFGVYDFRIPKAGGRSRLVGYGTPPGLLKN